jgi:hypothetical protein
MPHLIWVDVVSSISKNTTSRMLGTYRKLLLHKPVDPEDPGEVVLLEKTMGCDSTTVRLNLGSLLSIDTCPGRHRGFIGVESKSD